MASSSSSQQPKLKIVVMGYLVRCPIGGMAWHHLQYMLGLVDLGHDVYFLEDSGDEPWACYDPARGVTDADPSYGLRFAQTSFERLGLDGRWAYHDALASRWYGPAASELRNSLADADVLLNLSGANPLRPWVADIPVRVYVDTDPVFTQLRHLSDADRLRKTREHTAFFTFGENIVGDRHSIPDDGIPWKTTRQPVSLRAWPVLPPPADGPFTTVLQWDDTLQNVPREHGGRQYGRKKDSFAPFSDLPLRFGSKFELALGGDGAPREELRRKHWHIRDPLEVTRDPWTYQEYLQRSKGEFSIAKHGYVITRSGWFSERSAAYLASGRPVIVQETGFSDWLPTGLGVLSFSDMEGALLALASVEATYDAHCRAARETAEQYFNSRSVISRLLVEALG